MFSRLPPGCLAILMFGMVLLLPLFLADVMLTALARLGLSPTASLVAAGGIFLGGAVNIPIKRIPREIEQVSAPFGLYGVGELVQNLAQRQRYTVIAVNLGGCLVPGGIALYEIFRMGQVGNAVLMAGVVAIGLNAAVCYWFSRPVKDVGIVMQPIIPALTAALSALLLAPDFAPAVAFSAGVLGPLIGADLFHLREIEQMTTGMASIGGAGTFDGIVLSGLIATLLA